MKHSKSAKHGPSGPLGWLNCTSQNYFIFDPRSDRPKDLGCGSEIPQWATNSASEHIYALTSHVHAGRSAVEDPELPWARLIIDETAGVAQRYPHCENLEVRGRWRWGRVT